MSGEFGTRRNKIYFPRPNAWGKHKGNYKGTATLDSDSTRLVFVGNINDLADVSDEMQAENGRVRPEGWGPDD